MATALWLRFEAEWLLLGIYAVFCALVLGGFSLADRLEWRIGPYGAWKKHIQEARESGALIRFFFRLELVFLPGLLLFSAATAGRGAFAGCRGAR